MVKNWGDVSFLLTKIRIMDRLRQIVEKGKFWVRGAGEIAEGGRSKNTKAFGSGYCQSAVVDV